MTSLDKYSGQVTAEEVFFRAMLNISQLSTNVYAAATTDWQRNALNLEQAIENLEALASPFLDEAYHKDVAAMTKRYRERYRKKREELKKDRPRLLKMGHDLEVKLTCRVANERLALIQKCLHEYGIVFGKTYQVVDDGSPPLAAAAVNAAAGGAAVAEADGEALDEAEVVGMAPPAPQFDDDPDPEGEAV